MNVNTWTVRDTLGQPTNRPNHQATCALALELFESLLSIASLIDDAETFASEAKDNRDLAITYHVHVEMIEQIERADAILADVLATKGGE